MVSSADRGAEPALLLMQNTATQTPVWTQAIGWISLLACAVLAGWIRLQPLSLSGVEDRAEQSVRQAIRTRIASEIDPSLPQGQRQQVIAQQSQAWIEQHLDTFTQEQQRVAEKLKSRLRYEGQDGQEYVYLGDRDSYVWLRHARNYLETGTTCDAVVDDQCLDTFAHAPVGTDMRYRRSLHIVAIVGLHSLIILFKPDFPLPASAFLVPVVIGVLGVFPAFFLGRRLGDNLGGVFAVVLSALLPHFLYRSMGSDNDVWNGVLPVFLFWAILAALYATVRSRQLAYSLLAAVICGLYAGTWSGWFFSYAVALAGLLAAVLFVGLRFVLHQRTDRLGQFASLQRLLVVILTFYCAAGVCTTLAGDNSYLEIPRNVVRSAINLLPFQTPTPPSPVVSGQDYWPNNFRFVSELRQFSFSTTVERHGGKLFFFASLAGLLLLLLPPAGWRERHWLVLSGGATCFWYVLAHPDLTQWTLYGLLAAPLTGALVCALADQCTQTDQDPVRIEAGIIVSIWFLAGLYLTSRGIRFQLFLSPAFALGCAALVGRVHLWLQTWVHWVIPRQGRPGGIAHLLATPLVLYALVFPIERGYTEARTYLPRIDDAWWDTFTHIREASPADAIITSWWDFGHWAKYIAQRRVSADGASLRTHIPHWLGRIFVAANEQESLSVLRMLSCGSDGLPYAEGAEGAYGKLLATGIDAVSAYALLDAVLERDAEHAAAYLTERGFTPDQRETLLASTHCSPPETYLITNQLLMRQTSAWLNLGLWDFQRAYIARHAPHLPQAEAIADFVERFDYSEQQATALYTQAKMRTSSDQLHNFVAPSRGYLVFRWHSCVTQADQTTLFCPIGQRSQTGSILTGFSYRASAPDTGRLHMRQAADDGSDSVAGTPTVVVWAGPDRIEHREFDAPTFADLGILVDVPNQRILLGSPPILRSTLTHLLFLDGRYATHFEKFDERTTYRGDRVVTWKVNWEGQ